MRNIVIKPGFHQKSAGFTILELMLVIAVIGILAMVAVPKYNALKTNYYLESSAQTVIDELKYAKQMAMDYRATTYVIFDHSTVKVIQSGQVVDTKVLEPGVTVDPARSANRWLPQLSIDGTTIGHGIRFSFRGFPSATGTVHLTHSSGRSVGVDIAGKTGYLSIVWP